MLCPEIGFGLIVNEYNVMVVATLYTLWREIKYELHVSDCILSLMSPYHNTYHISLCSSIHASLVKGSPLAAVTVLLQMTPG